MNQPSTSHEESRHVGRPRLHPKVQAEIKKMIKLQGMQPGEQLGSEKQLCERFGVSRPSIRKALKQLACEGQIRSVPGKGHFVASPEHSAPKQKNLILCILGTYNPEALCNDSHVAGIVAGLQASFAHDEHRLLLEVLGSPSRRVESIVTPHLHDLAGLILVPMGHNTGESMLAGTPSNIPRVVVGRPVQKPDIPCVYMDHYDGMRRAVQHLLDVGHRRIALLSIANSISGWPGQQCTAAYQDTLRAAGLDENILCFNNIPNVLEANRQIIQQIRREHPDITAMVIDIFQDTIALRELAQMGVHLPHDLSVILIDDSEAAKIHNPPVTVFRSPICQLGEMGGHMLQELLAGRMPAPRSAKLNGELVVRDTVRPPTSGASS